MRHKLNRPKFTTALVTGASSGIGKAICDLLVENQINLIISARDKSRLETLAEKWSASVDVEIVIADLGNKTDRQRIVECIRKRVPDLIINNAGYGFYGEALSRPSAMHLDVLEVNGAAVIELTLEGAKAMIEAKKKGTILNVSSAAAFQIFPYFATYSSCKKLINHFSQSLDEELKPQGIRVLAACPGVVKTQFRKRAGGDEEVNTGMMKAEFAAEEIWKQILTEKQIHIFNWKYRFALFMTKFIPQSVLTKIFKKQIQDRINRYKP